MVFVNIIWRIYCIYYIIYGLVRVVGTLNLSARQVSILGTHFMTLMSPDRRRV